MNQSDHRYFILNKPYNMVSQFISPHNVGLLSDLDFDFPENTHAIGRLDNNSEGLLILTTNKKVTSLLFQGNTPHKRVYLVQVKNKISEEKLNRLQTGIPIRIKGGQHYITPACEVIPVENAELVYKYQDDFIQRSPNSWLLITLMEGKYHQVRKMVAAIGHRCLRLIRIRIEDLELGNLPPGAVRELEEEQIFKLLNI